MIILPHGRTGGKPLPVSGEHPVPLELADHRATGRYPIYCAVLKRASISRSRFFLNARRALLSSCRCFFSSFDIFILQVDIGEIDTRKNADLDMSWEVLEWRISRPRSAGPGYSEIFSNQSGRYASRSY